MKKNLLLLLLVTGIATINLSASGPGFGDTPDFFSKGSWRFGIFNPLSFNSGSYKADGEKRYNYTDYGFKVSADYFLYDGIGAGLMIKYGSEREKDVDDDKDSYSDFMLGLRLIYGTSLGGLNLYARTQFGFGSEVNKYTVNDDTEKYTDGILRTGIEFGSAFPLGEDNHITVDPHIGFKYTKYTNRDMTSDVHKDSELYLGVRLSVNLGCDDVIYDCSNDFEDALERVSKGRNVFEYSNKLDIYTLTHKDEYDFGFGTEEDKDRENEINLRLSYKRAIFDRVLVGASFSTYTYSYNYLNDDDEVSKGTSFFIGPVVEVHPFSQPLLGNFFIEGSIGIGSSKNKYEDVDGTTEYKYSQFNSDVNIGFDYGLSDFLSLVTRIGLESNTNKNKDTDFKTNSTDGYFSVGTRISF